MTLENQRASTAPRRMLQAAIVGAGGYTGAELCRFLLAHPNVRLTRVFGDSRAGQSVSAALPSLKGVCDLIIEPFRAERADDCDVVFLAVPHGTAAPLAKALQSTRARVIDLSADFRFRDRALYESVYGVHPSPELLDKAVYGLVEFARDRLKEAKLIAVPGCYPTATLLALLPLFARELVETEGWVVDAKSGVSGAGRGLSASTHFPEVHGGIRAYKVAGAHRHGAEIRDQLGYRADAAIKLTFTPHLVPSTRGILATAYGRLRSGVRLDDCIAGARQTYAGGGMVEVLGAAQCPDTLWVQGCNRAFLSYAFDTASEHLVAQGCIDNLVKGASGQAVQCMNVAFGLPESTGLPLTGMWP